MADLFQLRSARTDLRCRDRHAALLRLITTGGAKTEDREQCPAAFEGSEEASGCRSANRVDDEIDVMHHVFGSDLGIVDERIGAEVAQKCFVAA